MATAKNFGEFARNINKRAVQVEKNTEKTVRKGALQALSVAAISTPVDKGRARSGWFTSFAAPSPRVPTAGKSTTGASALNAVLVRGRKTIERWRLALNQIFITNNVEYIAELDGGSSRQAPSGMSKGAIAAAQAVFRRARLLKR